MRIVDLLKKEAVVLNADVSEKEQMLDLLVDLHKKVGNIEDKEAFKAGIMKRESEGPTAIAEGICIPHSKNDAVIKPGIAAITVPGGVDCEALDGEPSNLFFMIAAPAEGSDVHLEALSRLSTILMDPAFREKLLSAKDVEAFLAAIDEKETEKYGDEDKAAQVEEAAAEVPAKKSGYQVLAVTACPTGIAHTYMAAEALEEKGKELGISIKVETNGSGGAKNVLTQEEIDACDGIIIAADKNVEMARFDGKPVIKVKVSDGIHKSQELIERAVKGDGPIYHHEGGKVASTSSDGDESFGRQIYKHLMNGVSHMLPFVIGGGILIAIAFLGRHLIGFGTVVNMVGVGYICEFFTSLYDAHLPVEKSLALRLVLMLFGVIFLSLAASMYFTSNLGVAPYDATGFVLDDRTKIKYKWCRVITDLICTAVGFAFGGPVGIGTVVTAFMMGPVVAFFNKHVSEKLLAAKMPRLVVRVYDLRRFGGGVISSNGKFAA